MDVIRALQQFASPGLDQLMLLITNLGSETAYTLFLVVAYLGIDARAGRRIGIYFLASFYVNELLKGLFDTMRPFEIDPSLARSSSAQETALGPGFPSGHAQGSATFWGMATLYVRRWWFVLLAALMVVLVSLSRVYLGLHFPLDVIGGVLIGLAVVSLGAAIDRFEIDIARWLLLLLGVAVPFALHALLRTADSDILLGNLSAFLVAPALVRHDTSGPLWQRVLLTVIGVALAFAYLFGSSALLSDAVKDNLLWGFLRYLAMGLLVAVLVPVGGRALGLVPQRKRA